MIIVVFDHNISGIDPLIDVVQYHKGKVLHFEPVLFPMSNSSIQHIYVGF